MEVKKSYISISGYIVEISASRGKKEKEILIASGKQDKATYFTCTDDYMWQLALVAVANHFKVLAHYDYNSVENFKHFTCCKLAALSIDVKS